VFGKGWRSLPWAIGGGVGDCGQEGMYCDDHMRVDQAGVRFCGEPQAVGRWGGGIVCLGYRAVGADGSGNKS
jgi:hypothetical protein